MKLHGTKIKVEGMLLNQNVKRRIRKFTESLKAQFPISHLELYIGKPSEDQYECLSCCVTEGSPIGVYVKSKSLNAALDELFLKLKRDCLLVNEGNMIAKHDKVS